MCLVVQHKVAATGRLGEGSACHPTNLDVRKGAQRDYSSERSVELMLKKALRNFHTKHLIS
jgi:hypothetical protein